MKLLMIYCNRFAYKTAVKNLDTVPEQQVQQEHQDVIVAFVHGEAEDMEREKSVKNKLLKNIKWLAPKVGSKKVVLHSFAHLSESKAEPEFVQKIFDEVQAKLENAGYQVWQTPFGYFLDLQLEAPGFSLARVFKSL